MSLFQDFLSLSDVVGSVACQIPVGDPKADVNADSLWQEKDPAMFEARRDAAWKKEQCQKSRAAALLGEKISNTSVGQKLRWFDVTLGTADPYWQSNKAREDEHGHEDEVHRIVCSVGVFALLVAKTVPAWGLYNRSFFLNRVKNLLQNSSHEKHDFVLFILDIDDFKKKLMSSYDMPPMMRL